MLIWHTLTLSIGMLYYAITKLWRDYQKKGWFLLSRLAYKNWFLNESSKFMITTLLLLPLLLMDWRWRWLIPAESYSWSWSRLGWDVNTKMPLLKKYKNPLEYDMKRHLRYTHKDKLLTNLPLDYESPAQRRWTEMCNSTFLSLLTFL